MARRKVIKDDQIMDEVNDKIIIGEDCWIPMLLEEAMAAQEAGRLAGHDPINGLGLLKKEGDSNA